MGTEARTAITVLSSDEIGQRTEWGLMVPLYGGRGLRLVDCGDDRGPTAASLAARRRRFDGDVMPARYFGAASGLALATLATIALQNGEGAVRQYMDGVSPAGFLGVATALSDRTFGRFGIDLNQHSDDTREKNPLTLGDPSTCTEPLGCKFNAALGAVLLGANQPFQVAEARAVASEGGIDLPITEAAEGITIMQGLIPITFGIDRPTLHAVHANTGRHTPLVILEGQHAPNHQAQLVVDLAGYRFDANTHNGAGLNRYAHTPRVASELLPKLVDDFTLDPRLLQAVGLLLGQSTRLALSGTETPTALGIEVIPATK